MTFAGPRLLSEEKEEIAYIFLFVLSAHARSSENEHSRAALLVLLLETPGRLLLLLRFPFAARGQVMGAW